MRRTLYVLPVAAALGTLSACGSIGTSASGSTGSSSAGRQGVEVMTASSDHANVRAVTVHTSGVTAGTATFRLPGGSVPTVVHFVFGDGTLTANASKSMGTAPRINAMTCGAALSASGTYTIDPNASTGRFAGAIGHGSYTELISTRLPKLADGRCALGGAVQSKGSTRVTITVHGPLSLR
jgi:hypothetical protein